MSLDQTSTPTISRVCDDGALIELVYDPATRTTALAVATRDGAIRLSQEVNLPTGERLVPYSPRNTLIAHECVLLPSAVGDVQDKGDLLRSIQSFIHRYVDLSPT